MAVEVVQLLLDVAAKAASVVSVQPFSHHAHAIVTLLLVKRKMLHLGSDAAAARRKSLFRRCDGGLHRDVLTADRQRKYSD